MIVTYSPIYPIYRKLKHYSNVFRVCTIYRFIIIRVEFHVERHLKTLLCLRETKAGLQTALLVQFAAEPSLQEI